MTIYGAGFGTTNAVRFNGATAPFVVESDTQILATVPTGASTGLITVTTSYGTGASSSVFVVLTDTDGDGMPDEFEQQYFQHGTNASAGDDADGDGTNNLAEYRAGTDPLNAQSVLRITYIRRDGGNVVVGFPAQAQKRYRLEASATLGDGFPLTVVTSSRATANGPLELTDAAAASETQRFYRVSVLP